MKITAKTLYAIIAVAELAKSNSNLKAGDIANKYKFPVRFLELTLNELKKSGIVDSKRGALGGFFLIKNKNEISLFDIVVATEGDLKLLDCVKILNNNKCFVEDIFDDISLKIEKYMKEIKLSEIIKKVEETENLDFVI